MFNDVTRCLEVLNQGGIILYPTDTVWGIGCDATNDAAVERIIELKKRPDYKSFVTLVADEITLESYVSKVPGMLIEYLSSAEKPTTVIYGGVRGLSSKVIGPDGSAAIRIPRDNFCRALLAKFGKPLVSTSANISGTSTPAIFDEIDAPIKEGVDFVVNYKQDDKTASSPSSIIRWNGGQVEVIR